MRPSLHAPLSLFVCTALALSGCKPGDPPPAAQAQAQDAAMKAAADASAAVTKAATSTNTAAAPAGDDNLNAVLWMQRSQEYRAVAEQTYRAAAATRSLVRFTSVVRCRSRATATSGATSVRTRLALASLVSSVITHSRPIVRFA